MEGLAYLTFDADVKEEFVEDEAALKALFQLSQVAPGAAAVQGHWGQSPPGFLGRSQGGRAGSLSGHTVVWAYCRHQPCGDKLSGGVGWSQV